MAAVFLRFLYLGCIAFGGPAAHIAYFRKVFVEQLGWVSEQQFAAQLALCQFLPGPASSQLGFAIAYSRGGLPSAVAAFLGFTLPSFLLMLALALWAQNMPGSGWVTGAIEGMKLLAAVVVLDAVMNMGRQFCRSRRQQGIALLSLILLSLWMAPLLQLSLMALAALAGYAGGNGTVQLSRQALSAGRRFLMIFAVLLILAFSVTTSVYAQFYVVGSMVFGGGHVVLPLLESFLGPLIDSESFLLGYAAAQAVPGPMFSLATYLGAVAVPSTPVLGALLSTAAVFLPGFLLYLGLSGTWQQLAQQSRVMAAIAAVNAVAVGMLAAAWIDPVLSHAPQRFDALLVGVLLFVLLRSGRLPIIILIAGALVFGAWRLSV